METQVELPITLDTATAAGRVALTCSAALGCSLLTCCAIDVAGAPDPEPCTTVYGDVVINTGADWAAFVARGCTAVTGVLTLSSPDVQATAPTDMSAPASTLVSAGGLTVGYAITLSGVPFPSLTAVGSGGLNFSDWYSPSIAFPVLATVAGRVFAVGGPFSFPALRAVGGWLVMNEGPGFDLPVLQTVGGSLVLGIGSSDFSIPRLETVGGGLEIGGTLASFSLPALTTIGGGLFVRWADALTVLAFPALTTVNGGFYLEYNASMARLDLPRVSSVSGPMSVLENPALPQCLADAFVRGLASGPSSYVATGNDDSPGACP